MMIKDLKIMWMPSQCINDKHMTRKATNRWQPRPWL